jgi:hypothetical protein
LSGVAYNLAKKKEFWILTNKCENIKLKHENEAKGQFYALHVLKKDVLLL